MKSWFTKRKSAIAQIDNSIRRNSSADSPDSIIRNEVLDKIQRFINTDDDEKRFTYIEDIIQIQKQCLDLNSLYCSYIGNGTFNSFLNTLGSYFDEWLEFVKDKYNKPKHIDKSDHFCVVEILKIISASDSFFCISLCTAELLTATNELLAVVNNDIPERISETILLSMSIIENAMNAGPVSLQQQVLDNMNYIILFTCLYHNIINGTTKHLIQFVEKFDTVDSEYINVYIKDGFPIVKKEFTLVELESYIVYLQSILIKCLSSDFDELFERIEKDNIITKHITQLVSLLKKLDEKKEEIDDNCRIIRSIMNCYCVIMTLSKDNRNKIINSNSLITKKSILNTMEMFIKKILEDNLNNEITLAIMEPFHDLFKNCLKNYNILGTTNLIKSLCKMLIKLDDDKSYIVLKFIFEYYDNTDSDITTQLQTFLKGLRIMPSSYNMKNVFFSLDSIMGSSSRHQALMSNEMISFLFDCLRCNISSPWIHLPTFKVSKIKSTINNEMKENIINILAALLIKDTTNIYPIFIKEDLSIFIQLLSEESLVNSIYGLCQPLIDNFSDCYPLSKSLYDILSFFIRTLENQISNSSTSNPKDLYKLTEYLLSLSPKAIQLCFTLISHESILPDLEEIFSEFKVIISKWNETIKENKIKNSSNRNLVNSNNNETICKVEQIPYYILSILLKLLNHLPPYPSTFKPLLKHIKTFLTPLFPILDSYFDETTLLLLQTCLKMSVADNNNNNNGSENGNNGNNDISFVYENKPFFTEGIIPAILHPELIYFVVDCANSIEYMRSYDFQIEEVFTSIYNLLCNRPNIHILSSTNILTPLIQTVINNKITYKCIHNLISILTKHHIPYTSHIYYYHLINQSAYPKPIFDHYNSMLGTDLNVNAIFRWIPYFSIDSTVMNIPKMIIPLLSSESISNGYSYSAWVYIDVLTPDTTLSILTLNGKNTTLELHVINNHLLIICNGEKYYDKNYLFVEHLWYFIAFTHSPKSTGRDNSNNNSSSNIVGNSKDTNFTLYINGLETGSYSIEYPTNGYNQGIITIPPLSPSSSYKWRLSTFYIFKKYLTCKEIAFLYCIGPFYHSCFYTSQDRFGIPILTSLLSVPICKILKINYSILWNSGSYYFKQNDITICCDDIAFSYTPDNTNFIFKSEQNLSVLSFTVQNCTPSGLPRLYIEGDIIPECCEHISQSLTEVTEGGILYSLSIIDKSSNTDELNLGLKILYHCIIASDINVDIMCRLKGYNALLHILKNKFKQMSTNSPAVEGVTNSMITKTTIEYIFSFVGISPVLYRPTTAEPLLHSVQTSYIFIVPFETIIISSIWFELNLELYGVYINCFLSLLDALFNVQKQIKNELIPVTDIMNKLLYFLSIPSIKIDYVDGILEIIYKCISVDPTISKYKKYADYIAGTLSIHFGKPNNFDSFKPELKVVYHDKVLTIRNKLLRLLIRFIMDIGYTDDFGSIFSYEWLFYFINPKRNPSTVLIALRILRLEIELNYEGYLSFGCEYMLGSLLPVQGAWHVDHRKTYGHIYIYELFNIFLQLAFDVNDENIEEQLFDKLDVQLSKTDELSFDCPSVLPCIFEYIGTSYSYAIKLLYSNEKDVNVCNDILKAISKILTLLRGLEINFELHTEFVKMSMAKVMTIIYNSIQIFINPDGTPIGTTIHEIEIPNNNNNSSTGGRMRRRSSGSGSNIINSNNSSSSSISSTGSNSSSSNNNITSSSSSTTTSSSSSSFVPRFSISTKSDEELYAETSDDNIIKKRQDYKEILFHEYKEVDDSELRKDIFKFHKGYTEDNPDGLRDDSVVNSFFDFISMMVIRSIDLCFNGITDILKNIFGQMPFDVNDNVYCHIVLRYQCELMRNIVKTLYNNVNKFELDNPNNKEKNQLFDNVLQIIVEKTVLYTSTPESVYNDPFDVSIDYFPDGILCVLLLALKVLNIRNKNEKKEKGHLFKSLAKNIKNKILNQETSAYNDLICCYIINCYNNNYIPPSSIMVQLNNLTKEFILPNFSIEQIHLLVHYLMNVLCDSKNVLILQSIKNILYMINDEKKDQKYLFEYLEEGDTNKSNVITKLASTVLNNDLVIFNEWLLDYKDVIFELLPFSVDKLLVYYKQMKVKWNRQWNSLCKLWSAESKKINSLIKNSAIKKYIDTQRQKGLMEIIKDTTNINNSTEVKLNHELTFGSYCWRSLTKLLMYPLVKTITPSGDYELNFHENQLRMRKKLIRTNNKLEVKERSSEELPSNFRSNKVANKNASIRLPADFIKNMALHNNNNLEIVIEGETTPNTGGNNRENAFDIPSLIKEELPTIIDDGDDDNDSDSNSDNEKNNKDDMDELPQIPSLTSPFSSSNGANPMLLTRQDSRGSSQKYSNLKLSLSTLNQEALDIVDICESRRNNFTDKIRSYLYPVDTILYHCNSLRIRGMKVTNCLFVCCQDSISLIDDFICTKCNHDEECEIQELNENNKHTSKRYNVNDIVEIYYRRYELRNVAFEIFLQNGGSILLALDSTSERDDLFQTLKYWYSDISKCIVDKEKMNEKLFQIEEQWINREISNYEYLIRLNTLSGRSYNDLSQYPVFPWIIQDYVCKNLDINDPSVYRDLSKPMGALHRKKQFMERYESLEDGDIPPFHYGTHYSTAPIVLYYLARLQPFAGFMVDLQSGTFDNPTRMFRSIRKAWVNSSGEDPSIADLQDIKELIPEFFYLPSFLINVNQYPLGKIGNNSINNVELPVWANGSPSEFIRLHRLALESEYVSEHLPDWIDLIFGYKQQGDEARDCCNVFYYLTYEGAIDLENEQDETIRNGYINQIREFGQTPKQLFTEAHPRRKPLIKEISIFDWDNKKHPITPKLIRKQQSCSCDIYAPRRDPTIGIGCIRKVGNNSNHVEAIPLNCVFFGKKMEYYISWGYSDSAWRLYPVGKLEGNNNSNNNSKNNNNNNNNTCISFDSCDNKRISCIDISSDNNILIKGSEENGSLSIYRCNLKVENYDGSIKELSFENIGSLFGHLEPIRIVKLCKSYGIIISVSTDGECIMWDLYKMNKIKEIELPDKSVEDISVDKSNGTICICTKHTIVLLDVNGKLICQENVLHNSVISRSDISCDNERKVIIAVGYIDGTIEIYLVNHEGNNIFKLKRMNELEFHSCRVSCLQFTGKELYSGDVIGKVVCWSR